MSTINVSKLTSEIQRIFKEDPNLRDVKYVERGEYVNRDPARAPWVGVYRSSVDYEPRALGSHSRSWSGTVTVKLVFQVNGANGEDAEDELEDLLSRGLSSLFSNLSLSGMALMLKALRVEYSYDETESDTMDFQWAFVTLNYEVRTGA